MAVIFQVGRPKKVHAQEKDPAVVAAGNRIREIRERRGLERPAMAKKLRVKLSTLKNAENGWQKLGPRPTEDAEALMADRPLNAETAVVESFADYGGTLRREKAELPAGIGIEDVLRMSKDAAVQSAASALAVATGISEEEALAEVIRVGLSRR